MKKATVTSTVKAEVKDKIIQLDIPKGYVVESINDPEGKIVLAFKKLIKSPFKITTVEQLKKIPIGSILQYIKKGLPVTHKYYRRTVKVVNHRNGALYADLVTGQGSGSFSYSSLISGFNISVISKPITGPVKIGDTIRFIHNRRSLTRVVKRIDLTNRPQVMLDNRLTTIFSYNITKRK